MINLVNLNLEQSWWERKCPGSRVMLIMVHHHLLFGLMYRIWSHFVILINDDSDAGVYFWLTKDKTTASAVLSGLDE